MDLSNVYNQIIMIFSLMIAGYVLGKLKWITQQMVSSFSTFIVKIALPALVIGGMTIPKTSEKLKESGIILMISIVVYGATYIIAKYIPKLLKSNDTHRGIYEFAVMFPNAGFMGFPVIEAIFGKEAIFFTAIYNIPFNILLYTVGIMMVSHSKDKVRFDKKILLNPGVVASLIGFLIFILSIPVPKPIIGAIQLVGSTTTPISMIVIGAMLSSLPLKEMFSNWRVYVISMIRVLILPLAIYCVFFFVLHIQNKMLIGVPVMIAAMPVAANAAMMVQEYGSEPQVASQCILISIIGSMLCIPILSMLFI